MHTFLAFIFALLLTVGFATASSMMFSWRTGALSETDQKSGILLMTIIFLVCYVVMLVVFK